MSDETIADLFRRRSLTPNRAFVARDGEVVTSSDLYGLAHELSHEIGRAGAESGSAVAVECSASVTCLAAMVGAWILGAHVVPVDPQWGDWLRDRILRHASARVLVTDGLTNALTDLENGHPRLDERVAFVSYTSGSTGKPRGVILPHRKLIDAYELGAAQLARHGQGLPGVIGCAMRPSGLGVIGTHHLWAAVIGATTVMLPELTLATAPLWAERLTEIGAGFSYLVPPLVALLVRAGVPPERSSGHLICASGGAPLSASLHERFQRRFRIPLLNFYGLTEVGFTAFFGSMVGSSTAGSDIGPPGLGVARLCDPEFGQVLLAPESTGELQLAGPTIACGYNREPDAWQASLDGEWLRTGDIASRDAHGNYRIVGRLKHAVMRGGFLVYLSDVEDAAMEIDDVLEAGALTTVGAEEIEDLGLVVRAVPGRSLDSEDVKAHILGLLGRQRTPQRVVVVGSPLPRISQGKLDRERLAALWRELTAPDLG